MGQTILVLPYTDPVLCAQVQNLCTGGPVDVALCAGLLAVAIYQGEISLVDLLSTLMTFPLSIVSCQLLGQNSQHRNNMCQHCLHCDNFHVSI